MTELYTGAYTGIDAADGEPIHEGDRIRITLSKSKIYSELLLNEGIVEFERGSFKVNRDRLDDYSENCVFEIIEKGPCRDEG